MKEDRRETYDDMMYRTTDGERGQAPAVRVNRERQHVARSLDERVGAGTRSQAPIPEAGGAPLAKDVRARMEPRVGADLSNVRVHTSGESADAAEGMSAKAFTTGTDVHFGRGNYQPGTKEGDRLIAHELTHVVQGQRSGIQRKAEERGDDHAGGAEGGATVSEPGEPAELEADAVGDHVANDLHSGKGEGGTDQGPAGGNEKGNAAKEKSGGAKEKGSGAKKGSDGRKPDDAAGGEAKEKGEGGKEKPADGDKPHGATARAQGGEAPPKKEGAAAGGNDGKAGGEKGDAGASGAPKTADGGAAPQEGAGAAVEAAPAERFATG